MLGALVALLGLSLQIVSGGKCYAMTMEGGGMCGAYEAGALMALTELLPASELKWNFIGGISIGSYNTCWCSGFSVGDERNMAIHLRDTWLVINETDIVFRYRHPLIYALFWAPSVTENSASLRLIDKYSGHPIRRNVTVGTTSVDTGELLNFNETLGEDLLPTACWASGAFPGAFPPVLLMDEYYIDGCATANLNGFIIIKKCRDMGYKDEDIIIDLFYDVHPDDLPEVKVNTTKQTMAKISSIREVFKSQWFISQLAEDFPRVTVRYAISPSQVISNYPTIKPDDLRFKIDLGYNDTVKILKKSQTQRTQELRAKYSNNPHFS